MYWTLFQFCYSVAALRGPQRKNTVDLIRVISVKPNAFGVVSRKENFC